MWQQQSCVHPCSLCLCCCLCLQANIINDLLDFETLKGTSAAPELSRIDIDAAVRSVVRMFSNSARSKVTRLQVHSLEVQLYAHVLLISAVHHEPELLHIS
jgi:signal transduction histidine kinase